MEINNNLINKTINNGAFYVYSKNKIKNETIKYDCFIELNKITIECYLTFDKYIKRYYKITY